MREDGLRAPGADPTNALDRRRDDRLVEEPAFRLLVPDGRTDDELGIRVRGPLVAVGDGLDDATERLPGLDDRGTDGTLDFGRDPVVVRAVRILPRIVRRLHAAGIVDPRPGKGIRAPLVGHGRPDGELVLVNVELGRCAQLGCGPRNLNLESAVIVFRNRHLHGMSRPGAAGLRKFDFRPRTFLIVRVVPERPNLAVHVVPGLDRPLELFVTLDHMLGNVLGQSDHFAYRIREQVGVVVTADIGNLIRDALSARLAVGKVRLVPVPRDVHRTGTRRRLDAPEHIGIPVDQDKVLDNRVRRVCLASSRVPERLVALDIRAGRAVQDLVALVVSVEYDTGVRGHRDKLVDDKGHEILGEGVREPLDPRRKGLDRGRVRTIVIPHPVLEGLELPHQFAGNLAGLRPEFLRVHG